jgi:cAMP-dependent protein kinase regulator
LPRTRRIASKVWVLERRSLKTILAASAMHKRAAYLNALMQVPVFQRCDEFEMLVLADSITETKYTDGAVVCEEKKANDTFYIVKDGIAQCTVAAAEGAAPTETSLSVGSFWGEYSLVKRANSKFTVKAQGILRVGCIDRDTFTRVLGPLEEILQREDILS